MPLSLPLILTGMVAVGWLTAYISDKLGRVRLGDKMYLEDVYACSNYFEGNWTYDHVWFPYYNDMYSPDIPRRTAQNTSCPFIPYELNCLQHRLEDHDLPMTIHLNLRWKPNNCSQQRFKGENIFELYKGKRIMFVGDSFGHDQYISFVCLLHSTARLDTYLYHETDGKLTNVTFSSHNISVLFSRNDFLVDLDVGDQNERILKLDSIGNGGRAWKDADVLVFNSWSKWLQTGQNQSWDVIEEGNTRHKDMDQLVAYEKALKTWAKWVNLTLNTKKTKVFFVGDFNSTDWAYLRPKTCELETKPVAATSGPHPIEATLAKILKSLSKSVHFVDVAPLSKLRRNTHPSISQDVHDYNHWCLPGVPDAWNELLYATLVGY